MTIELFILFVIIQIGMLCLARKVFNYYETKINNLNKPKFIMTLEFENITIKGDIKVIGLKLAQKVRVTLQPVDRLGNPATVEAGSVSFSSSDEAICTVVQDPENELVAEVFSQGVGVAQLDYSADADLGEGVESISGFSSVEVLPLGAVGFGLEVGEPEDV